ncbi:hypothetical protein HRbin15_01401 [bacterium HR15]|nr:hypothetical protein HRbin15_01401 [bacterium HR15]
MMMRARLFVGILLTWVLIMSLFAQQAPGDYQFLLGPVVNGWDMDIDDIHYLGRNRETGLDEFLLVLRRTGNAPTTEGRIYFVHCAYGGTPPTLRLLNILNFRPRIQGDIGQPPEPGRARLVYQPVVMYDDRVEPDYWYLFISPGFVYRLVGDFYKRSDASIIIDGRRYQVDGRPLPDMALGNGLHIGLVWRPRGILNTPSVSSILIGRTGGWWGYPSFLIALDREGNVIRGWRFEIPGLFCEEPPCNLCEFPSLQFGQARNEPNTGPPHFAWAGGGSGIVGLTPTPGSNVDEYALLLGGYFEDRDPYGDRVSAPVVLRFGLDGRIRWAKAYRMFRSNGMPGTTIAYSPWWIVEDRASPTSAPNRLMFSTGYNLGHLWRVDRETGEPIWGYHQSTYDSGQAAFGFTIAPNPYGGWVISASGAAYTATTSDNDGIIINESSGGWGGTACWDYGNKYLLARIGGDYLVTGDDGNLAVGGDCNNGSVFLPLLKFKKLGAPSVGPCFAAWQPVFERARRICSTNVTVQLTSAVQIDVQRATADVYRASLPMEVACSVTTVDLCGGDTHCENGVRWGDGDVAPYPDDPHNAGLEDFGDCCVEDADLLEVLFNFGFVYDYSDPAQFKPGRGDVTCDGIVDDADLLIVLFNFGLGC